MSEALTREQEVKKQQLGTLTAFLKSREKGIKAALPKSLAVDAARLMVIVLNAASRNQKLLECTPMSIYLCMHSAAQLGLEPASQLGHFYLVPRWNSKIQKREATPLIGYKGYTELSRRTREIARIDAAVVYEGEQFRVRRGSSPQIDHDWAPGVERTDDRIVATYAVAMTKDGGTYFEPLDRDQVEARRRRSGSPNEGPWVTDYAAMVRKTALRALFAGGLVPMSAELSKAVAIESIVDAPDFSADMLADAIDVEASEVPEGDDGRAEQITGKIVDHPSSPGAAAAETQAPDPQPTRQPRTRKPAAAPAPAAPPAASGPGPAPAAPQYPDPLHKECLALIEELELDGRLSPDAAAGWRDAVDEHRAKVDKKALAAARDSLLAAKSAVQPQPEPPQA